jgi:proline iminopeptidase
MKVAVDRAQLFYSTRGTGPACLVLSSIGTGPYERMMPEALSDRLRLVFVDLRGGGQSTGDASRLTFDVLAADLEAIRADLGLSQVAILGHSIVGILAIEYARRCPDHVSHVIAVGTPPLGDMRRLAAESTSFFEKDASEERKRVLQENLARLPPDASMGQAMLAQTPLRFFDPGFDASPLFAEAEASPQLLKHLMGPLTSGWDFAAASDSLRVPTLLAHGRYDYTVPHVLWRDLASRSPGLTLQLFDQSGHQPFFEEPERFATVVSEWMARSRPPEHGGPTPGPA